jgi:hypothetical protein
MISGLRKLADAHLWYICVRHIGLIGKEYEENVQIFNLFLRQTYEVACTL